MTFELDHDAHEGIQVIAVSGDLDLASTPELRTALGMAASGKPPVLVLDLSKVSFIDSTALGALLRCNDELATDGVRLMLVCPPGPVQRLLAMTNLAGRLTLVTDRDSALAQARTHTHGDTTGAR